HRTFSTPYDRRDFHPEIQEAACRLFNHPTFSTETVDRLTTWLRMEFPSAGDVYGIPLREVADRLAADAERRKPGNPPPPHPEPEWTPADQPSRWAKLFGFSVDTLKRRCQDGTIRHKKLSS